MFKAINKLTIGVSMVIASLTLTSISQTALASSRDEEIRYLFQKIDKLIDNLGAIDLENSPPIVDLAAAFDWLRFNYLDFRIPSRTRICRGAPLGSSIQSTSRVKVTNYCGDYVSDIRAANLTKHLVDLDRRGLIEDFKSLTSERVVNQVISLVSTLRGRSKIANVNLELLSKGGEEIGSYFRITTNLRHNWGGLGSDEVSCTTYVEVEGKDRRHVDGLSVRQGLCVVK